MRKLIQTKNIRTYFKSLYSKKLGNINEMDDFIDRYHVPKLSQDQITYINNLIDPKEIKIVI